MAIGIQNFQNIIPPSTDYPSGRIKDDTGIEDGTPVNQETNSDIQEFFAKMMRQAGIDPNGLPDNEYSGNQYWQAFERFLSKHSDVSDSDFNISATFTGCTGTIANSRYSIQKTGRKVDFCVRILINISAVGGGNAWYNFKFTPSNQLKSIKNFTDIIINSTPNSYDNGFILYNSDNNGDIISQHDNSNIAVVGNMGFKITGSYLTN